MSGRLSEMDVAALVAKGNVRVARAPGKAEPPKVKHQKISARSNLETVAHAMSEEELQNNIQEMAVLRGWRYYHSWTSVNSPSGFPDLLLIRFTRENTCAGQKIFARLIVAELKREGKSPTPVQQEWLDDFKLMGDLIVRLMENRRVPALDVSVSVESYTWRPTDWISGRIEQALA